jgi:hypothetical protein
MSVSIAGVQYKHKYLFYLGYRCLFNQYNIAKTLKFTFLNRACSACYINMWHLESGSYTKETVEVQSHQ